MPDLRIDIPGGLGIHEGIDPRMLPATQYALVAQNTDFRTDGAWSKRYGHSALATTSLLTAPLKLFHYDGELLAANKTQLQSFDDTSDVWRTVGYPCACTTWVETLLSPVNTDFPGSAVDIAYVGGYLAIATQGSNAAGSVVVRLTVVELATGLHVCNVESTTTGVSAPRVLAVGNAFVLIYVDATHTYQRYVPISTFTAAAEVTLTTIFTSNLIYDVCTVSSTDYVIVGMTVSATKVAGRAITASTGATSASWVGSPRTGSGNVQIACSWSSSDNQVLVADASTAGGGEVYIRSAALTFSGTTVTAMSITGAVPELALGFAADDVTRLSILSISAGNGFCAAYDHTDTKTYYRWFTYVAGTSSTASGTAQTAGTVVLASRAFAYDSRIFAAMVVPDRRDQVVRNNTLSGFGTMTIVAFGTSSTSYAELIEHGRILPRQNWDQGTDTSFPVTSIVATSSTEYVIPNLVGFQEFGIRLGHVDFNHMGWMRQAVLGSLTYFSGGVPCFYDGSRLKEIGFLMRPQFSSANGGASSGSIAAGTYNQYGTLEEWDSKGVHHVSMLSNKITTTASALAKITATWNLDHLTRRGYSNSSSTLGLTDIGQMRFAHWREDTASGGVYYRTANVTNAAGDTLNERGTGVALTKAYVDNNSASSNLASQEIIYAQPPGSGDLESVAPPSLLDLVAHKNRLWGIGEDRLTIWYTTEAQELEAPRFNEQLTFRVDDTPEPATGLASLDDKLIVFKKNAIYVVFGDGANDAGTGSDLSSPQRIASDVGCIDTRSIVNGPDGVYFQSRRGIMRLTRGMQVEYVGINVETTLATYSLCKAAVMIPEQSHIRFYMCTPGSESAGKILLYDFRMQKWSVTSLQDSAAGVECATYHPTYGEVLTRNGTTTVWRETSAAFDDAGTEYAMDIKVGPVMAAGPNGYQRVRRIRLLTDWKSTHATTFTINYDSGPSYGADVITKSESDIAATGDPGLLRIAPPRRRCSSITVEVTDNPNGGTQESHSIQMISFEIVPMATGAQQQAAEGKT